MSTKKIVLIILGVFGVLALIAAVLALIVALFVGGIAWFTFHTIGNSEAAETARTFLRNNEILKRDIGEVKDFGSFVTGNVNAQNTDGEATLRLEVIGEKRTVNATVDLSYRNNRSWRVTGATYERDGQTIDLVQGYGPPTTPSPPAN
jgi:Cytochrome oxidase complex assembly protein 1